MWIDLCIKKVAVKPEAKGKKTGTANVILLISAVTGDLGSSPSLCVIYITMGELFEAVRMYLPTGLQAGLRQGLQEILAIHIIEVNVSAAIPAAHHARPAEASPSGEGGWYTAPLNSWRIWRGMVRLWRLRLATPTEMRKLDPFLGDAVHRDYEALLGEAELADLQQRFLACLQEAMSKSC